MEKQIEKCPLCSEEGEVFSSFRKIEYYKCCSCNAVFMERKAYPAPNDERDRYLEHENNVEDKRYQHFVRPITSRVLKHFSAHHKGLDFGSGTGPVITKVLTDKGYNIKTYDPFFDYRPERLEETYDYIVCCEVIEHFFEPAKEFERLRQLLKPGGVLYCMTNLYHEQVNFKRWQYKNDPTHVFFYHPGSVKWIREQFNFAKSEIDNRLILWEAPE